MKQILSDEGESFKFVGMTYLKKPYAKLELGDEVIIHPVPCKPYDIFTTTGFKSQATKSYPARIIVKDIEWVKVPDKYANYQIKEPKNELCLEGIDENKNWHGAVLNEYGFGRLEFVKRSSVVLSRK